MPRHVWVRTSNKISHWLSPRNFKHKKDNRKLQWVSQSQTAAIHRHKEEEKNDKWQTNKCTRSKQTNSLFPRRGDPHRDHHLRTVRSIQLFHAFVGDSQNYRSRGAVDDLMHCCPRPSGTQHEIIVLLPNTYFYSFLKHKLHFFWNMIIYLFIYLFIYSFTYLFIYEMLRCNK